MAESVDALVSNTSGAIRAGSTPAQGTEKRILTARVLFSFSHRTDGNNHGGLWGQIVVIPRVFL